MIEAGRADHSRAKLDHDLIVPITNFDESLSRSLEHTFSQITVPVFRNAWKMGAFRSHETACGEAT